jgi:hypothetical protein
MYFYFMSQSSEFCHHNFLCCFYSSIYCCKRIFLSAQSGNFWIHLRTLDASFEAFMEVMFQVEVLWLEDLDLK